MALRSLATLLAIAAPAHVEPQTSEAPAASRTTFSFVVEHGCDGSPTTEVLIQIPEGAFEIVPVAPAGWVGAVEQGDQPVVRFSGGLLPDDVEGTFGFELVTPDLPGQTVLFPTVQRCEVGEIAWIDPADVAEEPAPRVLLTENPSPILQTTTTAPAATSTEAPSTTLHELPAADATGAGDGGGSDMPTLLIGGAAVVAAAGAAVAATRRRAPR